LAGFFFASFFLSSPFDMTDSCSNGFKGAAPGRAPRVDKYTDSRPER